MLKNVIKLESNPPTLSRHVKVTYKYLCKALTKRNIEIEEWPFHSAIIGATGYINGKYVIGISTTISEGKRIQTLVKEVSYIAQNKVPSCDLIFPIHVQKEL